MVSRIGRSAPVPGALALVIMVLLASCGESGAPDERRRLTAVAQVRATAETVAERTESLSEFTAENYEALRAEIRRLAGILTSANRQEAETRRYIVPFHAVRASDDDGRRAADVTPQEVTKWVDKANEIFEVAGVRFAFNPDSRGPDWTEVRDTALNNLDAKLSHVRYAAQFSEEYPGKIVAIFRNGLSRTPEESAFSSLWDNVLVMPGFATTRWIVGKTPDGRWIEGQNVWMLAHELGHYFGLPHTFPDVPIATPFAAAVYLLSAGGTVESLDGDLLSDTPPDAGFFYYIGQGWDPCEGPESYTIKERIRGREFSWELTPDRHNVMSYFGCEPLTLTPMQVQVIHRTLDDRGFPRVD